MIYSSKHVDNEMPGRRPSGNVYPRGQSFPTVVPQEEVTDVLHVDRSNSSLSSARYTPLRGLASLGT